MFEYSKTLKKIEKLLEQLQAAKGGLKPFEGVELRPFHAADSG